MTKLFRYFLRKFQQTQTTEKNFSFTFIFLPQRILHSIRTYYLYDKIPNRREGESPSAVIQFPLSFLDPFVARIDESFVSNSCKTMIEGGWPWSSEWKPESLLRRIRNFSLRENKGKGEKKRKKGKRIKKNEEITYRRLTLRRLTFSPIRGRYRFPVTISYHLSVTRVGRAIHSVNSGTPSPQSVKPLKPQHNL